MWHLSFSVTSFSMIMSRSIQVATNGIISFFFYGWVIFLCGCVCVCVCVCVYTHVRLCAWFLETPCAIAHQTPLSMGFSRQEYWSGLPFPPAGISLTQGSNLGLLCLLHWQVDSSQLAPPGKPCVCVCVCVCVRARARVCTCTHLCLLYPFIC